MNEQEKDALVRRYLDELNRQLGELPASRRREFLEDVRGHIEEAWAESQEHSRAALLNILDRLGDPETLAGEEMERLGLPATPESAGPGFLEGAAVVLTVIFWPVGVLLAWLSPRWCARDKAVATALPALGFALLLSTSMVAYISYSSGPALVSSQTVEVAPSLGGTGTGDPPVVEARPAVGNPLRPAQSPARDLAARALALFGLLGTPLLAAVYLAMRMRPRPRRAALILPAAAAAFVALMLLVIVATPTAAQVASPSVHSGAAVVVSR